MAKYNNGQWTEARFHSFIKSALRKASQRWPPKFLALKKSFTGKKTNNKTGRIASHYLCESCKQEYPAKEVQVDHISPVIPLTGFTSWDEVISRMFCEAQGFQVLCVSCHKEKSKAERQERKQNNGKF